MQTVIRLNERTCANCAHYEVDPERGQPLKMGWCRFWKARFSAVSGCKYWVDRQLEAARAALAGRDPTGGALYFYSPELATCNWIRTRETTAEIGGHVFAR